MLVYEYVRKSLLTSEVVLSKRRELKQRKDGIYIKNNTYIDLAIPIVAGACAGIYQIV